MGLVVAFVGSSISLVLTLRFGPVAVLEAAVIASSAGMTLILCLLLIKPDPIAPRQVAAAAAVYFSLYLPTAAAAAIWDSSHFARIVPYLLWYYPLLAFAKFTLSGRLRSVLDVLIAISPALILLAYFLVHGRSAESEDFAFIWTSLTAYSAYAIFLGRFSGYREAIADQQARAEEALKAAEALQENEISYQRILSDAGAGIGMMNREGTILWANDKLAEWSNRAQVSGLSLDKLISVAQRPAWKAGIARVLQSEAAKFDCESTIAAAGEPPRVIQSTFLRAPGREDQPANIVFISFDVSELRSLDSQLRQSQKMEALGRLTGGIAHDFNNLLTVILGSSEALTYRLEGRGEEQELAGIIEEAAERAAGLVRHLLAFSQKQTLAPRPTDVCELIDTA
ncbi:MAG: histidine kinase dimerization/phospho-acceptor domain-containing protein, partial [Hyphomonas sp.]